MSITRQNHYVPRWYQDGFLLPGQTQLHYLNFFPEKISLPDGKIKTLNERFLKSPKSCFWQKDLYTISFFGLVNDEIERYLFGGIDNKGSAAVRGVLSNEFVKIHHSFQDFFEYLDAQKLRTPKGLDWIKTKFPRLNQIQLMYEMQKLRQMNCTMWIEAVREIVSAENSKVKFIISDHPITVYNRVCPPNSEHCKYPKDPPIEFIGSQTIFPLDLSHCLILTNLEYARDRDHPHLLRERTNARRFGNTISRTDAWIRERKLTEEDVLAINYILKFRARRYIAASDKDWLNPETRIKRRWEDLASVLMPPKDGIHHFGGELYIGYKDGSTHYQDEFGRTQGDLPHLNKNLNYKPGANDLCSCGSGKKFKKCCRDKPESVRPTSKQFSIRERNIFFFNTVMDILGLSKRKTWEDVQREISNEQIEKIYKVLGSLWPTETNLAELLPQPDPNVLRALYAGLVDPRMAIRNVIALSLYSDEIIFVSPFINPACIKDSPLKSPGKYKSETLKNVLLLIQLYPFIEAGFINMIPDPCDFNYALRKQIYDLASQRMKGKELDETSKEQMKGLFEQDYKRAFMGMPEEALANMIKRWKSDLSDDEVANTVQYMKKKQAEDPLALLQTLPAGEEGAQFIISHLNPNFETGLYLALLTGSFIYTDNSHRWNELMSVAKNTEPSGREPLAKAVSDIPINFFVNPLNTFLARKSGCLGSMRKALRNIWNGIQKPTTDKASIDALISELKEAVVKSESEWQSVQKRYKAEPEGFPLAATGKIHCKIPLPGFGINSVYRLLVSHSRRQKYVEYMPMALFLGNPDAE